MVSSARKDNDRHRSQSFCKSWILSESSCTFSWMESGVLKPRQLGLCGRTFGKTLKPRRAEVTGPARSLRAHWPTLCTIRTLGLRFLVWSPPSYMFIVRYAGLFPRIFGRLYSRTLSIFGFLYASTSGHPRSWLQRTRRPIEHPGVRNEARCTLPILYYPV
jgi:hypothetical protein